MLPTETDIHLTKMIKGAWTHLDARIHNHSCFHDGAVHRETKRTQTTKIRSLLGRKGAHDLPSKLRIAASNTSAMTIAIHRGQRASCT